MQFKESQPIYLQMAERLCDEILAGGYAADERIPSVREYAASLEVNANTAVKCYDHLTRLGIIYTKRGLGYFVSPDARAQILESRRLDFYATTLPEVFHRMRLLGISLDDLREAWNAQSQSGVKKLADCRKGEKLSQRE